MSWEDANGQPQRRAPPSPAAAAAMSCVVASSARALFADLVRKATDELNTTLSPVALTYVIELLDARLRAPHTDDSFEDRSLGAALLRARCQVGSARVEGLRAVGDSSLFIAGFFGDSLRGRGLSERYYEQIGSEAYGTLANSLCSESDRAGWSLLFGELSAGFVGLVELLGEVGDLSRAQDSIDLLGIYSHYLDTGSRRDCRRLLRRGVVPLVPDGWEREQ